MNRGLAVAYNCTITISDHLVRQRVNYWGIRRWPFIVQESLATNAYYESQTGPPPSRSSASGVASI